MMRRRAVLGFLAGAACAAVGTGPLAVSGAWAAPAVAAGVWGKAIEVPGLGNLNQGGDAGVASASCTAAGNCAAGGFYRDRSRHLQGFVATERRGRWGQAAGVPGLGALNKGGNARVVSVVCSSAGNCAAAGDYQASGHQQGFVVSERNGQWGRAAEVPGLGALNKRGTQVIEASCASAGNCAIAGNYTDGDGHRQGFVASEKNGAWAPAIEVPGLGALNQGGAAGAWSVSCRSAGNCAVAGDYTDGDGHRQGFVGNEQNGTWGTAIEVPGLGALNQGVEIAGADTVSCVSAGNCTAGGYYTDSSSQQQGFLAVERNGAWGPATGVPGLEALNDGTDQPEAFVSSVSCTSPRDCLAGGAYGGPYSWAFTATEKNGIWGKATIVAGLSSIVTGRWSEVGPVSCVSPGNCAIAGDYENVVPGNIFAHGFVASQRNGRLGNAINMPALKVLTKTVDTDVFSVSCGSPGHCTTGGSYQDSHGHQQGFVTQSSTP